MIDEAGHVEAGIREGDSEFGLVLEMFGFGKVDEVLDHIEEFRFGDLSGSIVLAQDLEGSITVARQIIAAIRLPISGRDSQRSREIVRVADGIHGIVPACAHIRSGDPRAESSAVLIGEILLILLGRYLGFGFFGVDLGHEIGPQLIEIIVQLFVAGELLLQVLELRVECPLVLHVAGGDGVEMIFERYDLKDVQAGRLVRIGAS